MTKRVTAARYVLGHAGIVHPAIEPSRGVVPTPLLQFRTQLPRWSNATRVIAHRLQKAHDGVLGTARPGPASPLAGGGQKALVLLQKLLLHSAMRRVLIVRRIRRRVV